MAKWSRGWHLSQTLWTKSLKIYRQSSINEPILGETIGFEFEGAYKLQVVSQRKTLGILRIELLSSQAHMNHETFELLLASSVFQTMPQANQDLLCSIMSMPTEAMSVEAATTKGVVPEVHMAAEGATPEGAPAEIPAEIPKSPRMLRPWPTPTTEGPKIKKGQEIPTEG